MRLSLQLTALATLAGTCLVGAAMLFLAGKPVSSGLAVFVAALLVVILHRTAAKGEKALALVISQIASGLDDRPQAVSSAFRALDNAARAAMDRLAEERLSNQQASIESAALLDNVSIALLVLHPNGSILNANRAARHLLGSRPRSLSQVALLSSDDANFLRQAQAGTKELVSLTDGRTVLAGVATYAPAGAEERRLVSLQLVAGDLSAVELNAWQSMARVLAHEMMNSLTPVISLAESLEALCAKPGIVEPAEVSRTASLIARRAAHIANFTDRYRELADIPQPIMAPVNVSDLLQDVAALAAALPGKHIVSVIVRPPRLSLVCDRELLEQALLNLVKNAVEATADEDDPRICLEARSVGDGICIEVTDNGSGLPTDYERIFLPYYSTKAGGSGVGLAISRQIARGHMGTLIAEKRNQGAAFKMRLPKRI